MDGNKTPLDSEFKIFLLLLLLELVIFLGDEEIEEDELILFLILGLSKCNTGRLIVAANLLSAFNSSIEGSFNRTCLPVISLNFPTVVPTNFSN